MRFLTLVVLSALAAECRGFCILGFGSCSDLALFEHVDSSVEEASKVNSAVDTINNVLANDNANLEDALHWAALKICVIELIGKARDKRSQRQWKALVAEIDSPVLDSSMSNHARFRKKLSVSEHTMYLQHYSLIQNTLKIQIDDHRFKEQLRRHSELEASMNSFGKKFDDLATDFSNRFADMTDKMSTFDSQIQKAIDLGSYLNSMMEDVVIPLVVQIKSDSEFQIQLMYIAVGLIASCFVGNVIIQDVCRYVIRIICNAFGFAISAIFRSMERSAENQVGFIQSPTNADVETVNHCVDGPFTARLRVVVRQEFRQELQNIINDYMRNRSPVAHRTRSRSRMAALKAE